MNNSAVEVLTKEELAEQKGIEKERLRPRIERFRFKKMPGWAKIGPVMICLGTFALLAYMLYEYKFSHADYIYNFGSDGWWVVAALIAIPTIWFGSALDIEDAWRRRWMYKSAIQEHERKFSMNEYWKDIGNGFPTDHIYTDFRFAYYFYQASKTLFGLITILVGVSAALWGWTILSNALDQYPPGEQLIIGLLGAIFIALLSIGNKLRER